LEEEIPDDLKELFAELDASEADVDKAKADADAATDFNELKLANKALQAEMDKRDLIIDQIQTKNNFLLKRLNSESEKRSELEFSSRDMKNLYDKVSTNDSLQALVQLSSKKDSDDSSKKSYIELLRTMYETAS